jgi:uncharacterized membrane protein
MGMLVFLLVVAGWGSGWLFWGSFPEKVATHWNFAGEVDGYSSREVGAFLMPVLMLVMYVMFLVLPKIDPHKQSYKEFAGAYKFMQVVILGMVLILHVVMGAANLGSPIAINQVVPMVIGVGMILMGLVLDKIKQNWFVGIKTPWTLSSPVVWEKTHRAGKWVFIVLGGLMMVAPGLFLIGTIMMLPGIMGYSYWVYKQEKK